MASLYISEATRLEKDGDGFTLPVFPEPSGHQKVTFTTSTQSADFGGEFIRLFADADCHIAFGDNPTATANHPKYAANVEYFRSVRPGEKLSVYDGTS